MSGPDPHYSDSAVEQVTKLLTDLANDPAAPPSAVDAMSVIRAARAASAADPATGAAAAEGPAEPTGPPGPDPLPPPFPEQSPDRSLAPSADRSPKARPDDVIPFRPRRRRVLISALVAAASLAAIAALVVPLTLSGGSSTSMSSDAERVVGDSQAMAAASAAEGGGEAQQSPRAGSASDLAAAPGAAGPEEAATGEAATGEAAPGPEAAQAAPDAAPSESDPSAAAGGAPTGSGCWPALAEPVSAALIAALPAGSFGDPAPLAAECRGEPVGGAVLSGSNPPSGTSGPDADGGPVLVVRITRAEPGACLEADAAGGGRCLAQPDGTFLSTAGAGSPTVFAYGNGDEVAIGGSPDTGAGSGLSVDQLAAVARAVVGALG